MNQLLNHLLLPSGSSLLLYLANIDLKYRNMCITMAAHELGTGVAYLIDLVYYTSILTPSTCLKMYTSNLQGCLYTQFPSMPGKKNQQHVHRTVVQAELQVATTAHEGI
jgi:hypothetical protein